MRKVKIIKVYDMNDYGGYDYMGPPYVLCPASGDWEEVDNSLFSEIKQSIEIANRNSATKGFRYILAEYSTSTIEDVFDSADEFVKEMQRREEARLQEQERKRIQNAEKAKERKRKQLEKLKKELGPQEWQKLTSDLDES